MALNRSDKSRILRRYFPGMTRNSEMSTEPSHGRKQNAVRPKYWLQGSQIRRLRAKLAVDG